MKKGDKCYTKQNKNGGNYTTCVSSKGKQLREKDIKPKKKKAVAKKRTKIARMGLGRPLENISDHMSALSASAPMARAIARGQ